MKHHKSAKLSGSSQYSIFHMIDVMIKVTVMVMV